MAMNIYPPML